MGGDYVIKNIAKFLQIYTFRFLSTHPEPDKIRDMRIYMYSLLLLSMLAYTLKAEYKSPVDPKDYPLEEITKGVSGLRALPSAVRECLISETMGMLISPSHEPAYQLALKTHAGERYHPVYEDAHFITGSGKVCNFYKMIREVQKKKTINKAWVQTKQAMANTSAEVLFGSFEKDVTKVALTTAKYYLKNLPPKLRDAWFALYGNMAYRPDGNDATFTEKSWKRIGTVNFVQMYTERTPMQDTLYKDSEGNEHKLNEVWDKYWKLPDIPKKLRIITWCSILIGANDIMELYPKEVGAMKKHFSEAMEKLEVHPE